MITYLTVASFSSLRAQLLQLYHLISVLIAPLTPNHRPNHALQYVFSIRGQYHE